MLVPPFGAAMAGDGTGTDYTETGIQIVLCWYFGRVSVVLRGRRMAGRPTTILQLCIEAMVEQGAVCPPPCPQNVYRAVKKPGAIPGLLLVGFRCHTGVLRYCNHRPGHFSFVYTITFPGQPEKPAADTPTAEYLYIKHAAPYGAVGKKNVPLLRRLLLTYRPYGAL